MELWEYLMCAQVLLLALFYKLFAVGFKQHQANMKAWGEAREKGKQLHAELSAKHSRHEAEIKLLAQMKEQLGLNAEVARWVTLQTNLALAEQVPTVHSDESIRNLFYEAYDPLHMKAVFLSSVASQAAPEFGGKAVLYVVIFGIREKGRVGEGLFFCEVYRNNGEHIVTSSGWEQNAVRDLPLSTFLSALYFLTLEYGK